MEENKAEIVRVNAGKGYDVRIGRGLISQAGVMAGEVLRGGKAAVFTDSSVDRLYADQAEQSLRDAGFETCRFVFSAGELSKNIQTVAEFIDFMSEHHLTRKDAVIALGGGVAGDMGGFAASIYLRGIDFIQIPTTLLAAVDSSVGGKTGVNIASGKNLLGAFWQPSLVLYDIDTFKSLNNDQVLDGTAEAIKTGAIRDASLFELIEEHEIADVLPQVVKRCIEIKGAVVDEDEKESGLRRILNFGHTMAHSIEKASDYEVSHGKAVAIGMLMMTAASQAAGLTEQGTYERLKALVERKGFETSYSGADLKTLCRLASGDKKTSGDKISLVYIEKIGTSSVHDVKLAELEHFMKNQECL